MSRCVLSMIDFLIGIYGEERGCPFWCLFSFLDNLLVLVSRLVVLCLRCSSKKFWEQEGRFGGS